MFSFLYPAFLIGALSVAIPIVLHLLTREAAPRVPFSAVIFLKRVPVEDSRRRLRELLLLALRVAALLLLAFAFARPFVTDAASLAEAGVTIVAIDTSFSMGGPGRFERAQSLGRDAVRGARGRVGVIEFSDAAEVVAPVVSTPGEALAAIESLKPGFGATRYASALTLAAELIGGANGRIVLVTDLQQHGWDVAPEAVVRSGISVETADAGATAGNLAVTDMRADGGGLAAVIRNASPQTVASRARLMVDGKPVSEMPIMAPPGVSSEVRFATALPRTGGASVTIDDPDGYPADNTRYMVLDPPAPRALLAVTIAGNAAREAFYLAHAIAVDPRAFELATASVGGVAEMTPDQLGRYAGVLLAGTRGFDRRGREILDEYVRNGGAVFVVAGPDVDADAPARFFGDITLAARVSDAGGVVSFAPSDARHPIFRSFGPLAGNLSQVRFSRSILIEKAPGATILARFSNGLPALLEYEHGRGRVLHFASDLNRAWNDFPVHPTFVPFVQESLRYLTMRREEPNEYVIADVPEGVRPEPGVVLLPAPRTEEGEPARVRRVAVNVNARESDPSRIAPDRLIASLSRVTEGAEAADVTARQEHEERQRFWQYGLALMLVSLVCESALGRRM